MFPQEYTLSEAELKDIIIERDGAALTPVKKGNQYHEKCRMKKRISKGARDMSCAGIFGSNGTKTVVMEHHPRQ